jgi:O-antigen/teichoic acid export membrane protein
LIGKLLRESAIYGGGDFFLKVIAFFTFPLLAGALSTTGFGFLELSITIITLGGVLVRCGLNNAVQRYYWDQSVQLCDRPIIVSTGLLVTLLFGLAVSILVFCIAPLTFPLVAGGDTSLSLFGGLAIAVLLSFTQWAQYVQDILRLHFAPWRFLVFSFASRALGSILAVIVVLHWAVGVEGVLIAQALVLVVVLPVGIWLIRKDVVFQFDAQWSKRLLSYGAPFIFTELAYWLFSSIDRWMLASMAGVDEVGLYSVAFRFSSLALFVATAFGMAWSPYAVKLRSDHPQHYRRVYAQILLILMIVMLSVAGTLALFSGEILSLFLAPEYSDAAVPLAILCFTTVFQASQQVTAIGISLANRTKVFAYLVWAAAVLNVVLNWFLIPTMGGAGAALATLFAYFFLFSGFLYFTQRYYPLPFDWGRLIWLILLGGVVLVTSLVMQSSTIEVGTTLFKLLVAGVCLLLAWPVLDLKFLSEVQRADKVVK